GGEGAEAVAEAVLHDLVEVAGAGGDVRVDQQALEAVALDGERPEALVLDQVAEDLVARLAELGDEVHRLTEAEQVGPGRQRAEEGRYARSVERPGRFPDFHTFYGIVEHSV